MLYKRTRYLKRARCVALEVALSQFDTSLYEENPVFVVKRPGLFSSYAPSQLATAILSDGALTMIAAINILPAQYNARQEKAISDIMQLDQGIRAYVRVHRQLPTNAQGVRALAEFVPLTKDPWGNAYQYIYHAGEGRYDIFSLGKDGKPGGLGKARDIRRPDLIAQNDQRGGGQQ
jgi:general secretion pathway protein G